MSIVAAGNIIFAQPLNNEKYTELSNFVTMAAISSEIGVKLQYNISTRLHKRLIQNNFQLPRMAYELIENFWWSQSDALFDAAVYNDDFSCAGLDKKHSKVIRIQNFFECVFKSDLVKEITFELWEALPPIECEAVLSIHPEDFLDVIDKAYQGTRATDSSLIPTIQIRILR